MKIRIMLNWLTKSFKRKEHIANSPMVLDELFDAYDIIAFQINDLTIRQTIGSKVSHMRKEFYYSDNPQTLSQIQDLNKYICSKLGTSLKEIKINPGIYLGMKVS